MIPPNILITRASKYLTLTSTANCCEDSQEPGWTHVCNCREDRGLWRWEMDVITLSSGIWCAGDVDGGVYYICDVLCCDHRVVSSCLSSLYWQYWHHHLHHWPVPADQSRASLYLAGVTGAPPRISDTSQHNISQHTALSTLLHTTAHCCTLHRYAVRQVSIIIDISDITEFQF